jgi:hypothetical protein
MSARNLGYQWLIERLGLRVRPLPCVASATTAVNRKKITPSQILFPDSVICEDTPIGHIEFALRHEDFNLEVIAAAYEKIAASELRDRYAQTPNGEFIRKACYLWEWMHEQPLDLPARTSVGYISILDPGQHATAQKPTRSPKYRIEDNLLGNKDFCPIVTREAIDSSNDLLTLMQSVEDQFKELQNPDLYARAILYLFLSESKGSFAIESEKPSAGKEERFVQLLSQTGSHDQITEDWLVELQNAAVRDDFSFEASFRTKQNWLEDRNGRLSFMPPSPRSLQRLMQGWTRFTNDRERGIPLQAKLACSAFGFVYLHPFMDGNGRLHRFLIHHLLTQSGVLAQNMIIPVSATIIRQMMPEYVKVLTSFSGPTTKLWEYIKTDNGPSIRVDPGATPYAYFNADREVRFLHEAIRQTITQEIPRELSFLAGYDEAARRIEEKYDLPSADISKLIRMIEGNKGVLSSNKRKQFLHLPDEVIKEIEGIVMESFDIGETKPGIERLQ